MPKALALILALLASPAFAQDIGGFEPDTMQAIVANAARYHPITDQCDSACGLWLMTRGTCVTPSASFGFHSPTLYWPDGPMSNNAAHDYLQMIRTLRPRVAARIAPCLHNRQITAGCRFSGAQMIADGVPACGGY